MTRQTNLPGGACLVNGPYFSDQRGFSYEAFNCSLYQIAPLPFSIAQENIVYTANSGTIRGLHYQVEPFAQSKLVMVIKGRAQFFWVSLEETVESRVVHSICLDADGTALLTPAICAHGFLALEDDTIFSLKMSAPINHAMRGEISVFADDLEINFAIPPAINLLTDRDRSAPNYENRRRS